MPEQYRLAGPPALCLQPPISCSLEGFEFMGRSTCSAFRVPTVANGVSIFTFLQHLTHDHFNMLVVDLHALQTVNLLDFLHQIIRQVGDAVNPQDIVRRWVAIEEVFALSR